MNTYMLFDTTPPVTTYTWKKYNVSSEKYDVNNGTEEKYVTEEMPAGKTSYYSLTQPTILGSSFQALTSPVQFTGNTTWDVSSANSRYTYFKTSETATSTTYYKSWFCGSGSYLGESHSIGTRQIQGSYIEDVTSTNRSAYPDNGISGGYWYVFQS